MSKKWLIGLWLLMCPLYVCAADISALDGSGDTPMPESADISVIDEILELLQWQYSDEMDSLMLQDIQDDLYLLAEQPINLNHASSAELSRLPFLSSSQIDELLLYAYRHPFSEIYELRLVPLLHMREIRLMLPFVYVGDSAPKEVHPRQWFQHTKHHLQLRLDARSIENTDWQTGDPFSLRVQYRMQASQHFSLAFHAKRDALEPFYYPGKTYGMDFYGGAACVQQIGCLDKAVLGDYRINWGQGLVIGMSPALYAEGVHGAGRAGRGIQAMSSPLEYGFLRGAAAEMHWGNWALSVAASYRHVDGRVKNGVFPSIQHTGYHITDNQLAAKRAVGQQVYAMQAGWHKQDFRIDISAVAHLLSDTLRATHTYYNEHYFSGRRQWTAGLSFSWRTGNWYLFGEGAAASNQQWGGAAVIGAKYLWVEHNTEWLLSARYYSPWYDNLLGGADYLASRATDERSVEVGVNAHLRQNVSLEVSVRPGYFAYPKYGVREAGTWGMNGRVQLTAAYADWTTVVRATALYKRRFASTRLLLQQTWQTDDWQVRMQAVAAYCPLDSVKLYSDTYSHQSTYGVMGGLSAGYTPSRLPLRLRVGASAFYAPYYHARLSTYESTVQGSMGFTSLYGEGGRVWLMMHYGVAKWLAIEAEAGCTLYTSRWAQVHTEGRRHLTSAQLLLLFTL